MFVQNIVDYLLLVLFMLNGLLLLLLQQMNLIIFQ